MLTALRKLIKSEKSTDDPTWLCCLPLFHFLSKQCEPYQDTSIHDNHNAKIPVWWGKDDIEDEMDFLKGKSYWKLSVIISLSIFSILITCVHMNVAASFISFSLKGTGLCVAVIGTNV